VTVFVTGATGKLGPHVIASLVADGERVRALVRDPGKARALLPAEAELVQGDFAALPTIEAELAAANSMLLLTPHGPDMAAVQNTLINLAARAGTRVVKVSGTSAGIRPDGPDACRQHFDTEQHLAHSGVPWAVVRPNGFMQTLIVAMAATVRERGLIANPLGTAGISLWTAPMSVPPPLPCSPIPGTTVATTCSPARPHRPTRRSRRSSRRRPVPTSRSWT